MVWDDGWAYEMSFKFHGMIWSQGIRWYEIFFHQQVLRIPSVPPFFSGWTFFRTNCWQLSLKVQGCRRSRHGQICFRYFFCYATRWPGIRTVSVSNILDIIVVFMATDATRSVSNIPDVNFKVRYMLPLHILHLFPMFVMTLLWFYCWHFCFQCWHICFRLELLNKIYILPIECLSTSKTL